MIAKLRADTTHVQHIQDFWGDPLTRAGAQSADGKATYVQVYLAGNMGEALGNDSVAAVQKIVRGLSPPPGVKVFVTGGPALQADQQAAGDKSIKLIEYATIGVILFMLLFFYRSVVTVLLVLTMLILGLSVTRGVVAFLGYHDLIGLSTFATQLLVTLAIAATTDYAIFPDRALPGGPNHRAGPRVGLLHDVRWHRPRRAGLGHDDRGRNLLPVVHPAALLPDPGRAVGGRHGRRGHGGPHAGPGDHHRRESIRSAGTQARHANSLLAPAGAAVVRWPGWILTLTIMIALVGLVTLPGYQPNYNDRKYLPASLPANEGFAAAERHFPVARMNPELLLVETDHDVRNSADFLVIDQITKAVTRLNGIGRVQSITRPDGKTIEVQHLPPRSAWAAPCRSSTAPTWKTG